MTTKEVMRILRPGGGVALIGRPGSMAKTVRGPLKGAGEWTHQYADPASTLCATDRLAKGPLRMLWFTDFGFQMPNRHGRGPAPLCTDGILVIQGMHGLLAVDAYNGHRIWELPIRDILKQYDGEHLLGTSGTNSNMCLAGDSIFLRMGNRCIRIALATGKKLREYVMPGRAGVWGYVACEAGTLLGTRANETHLVRFRGGKPTLLTESHELFALDIRTGRPKWSYKAKNSIRHNAIVMGNGRVYVIDRPLAQEDLRRGKKAPRKPPAEITAPAGTILLCLDAATGKVLWENTKDIYGTTLVLSTKHDVLVMGYQYSQRRFQLPSEKGNRLTGFRASGGKRLWDARDKYVSRPLINDRTLITQPFARDLMTGKRHEDFRVRGRGRAGCGTISGSTHLLLYRSGTLGYTDLLRNKGTESWGGIRPGCWINTIVAGGLVLMPDATDRCTCAYVIKASIALQPPGRR